MARMTSSTVWPGIGSWGESDDVAGMARLEGGANLALGFKATDAGTVSRSRIDDNKGALALVDLNVCGRDDGASI